MPTEQSAVGAGSPGPMHSNLKDNQRAAFVRVALAVLSAIALPLYFPGASEWRWVTLGYLAGALLFQVAITKNFGGVMRVILGGVMDVAVVTFMVHRGGTQSMPLVATYLLIGMFNALVAPAWVARSLAALGVLAYATIAYGEALLLLPHAPDFPGSPVPDVEAASRGVAVVAILVAVSTLVSELMARALHAREAELLAVNGQLQELSQRDPLTQLFNRRHFVDRAGEELARVRRGHPMVLLMMDLDGFKHVNDEQGHLAGDELLKKIANTIRESTRAIDIVGRFGGDEFVAMLPDTDVTEAALVAERLVRAIREVGTRADRRRPVTVSIGIAVARPEDDVMILLNAADDGAYRAKEAGGNGFHTVTVPASEIRMLGEPPGTANAG
jgi:diguanylate cyclase (GGDEF)-like protein